LLSEGLVPVACAVGAWPLHVLTVGMAAVALAGVVFGARHYAQERAPGRHFAAGTSILIDLFFLAVVLFEGVPSAVLSPCLS
jgi:negative regulator of sigma E activity